MKKYAGIGFFLLNTISVFSNEEDCYSEKDIKKSCVLLNNLSLEDKQKGFETLKKVSSSKDFSLKFNAFKKLAVKPLEAFCNPTRGDKKLLEQVKNDVFKNALLSLKYIKENINMTRDSDFEKRYKIAKYETFFCMYAKNYDYELSKEEQDIVHPEVAYQELNDLADKNHAKALFFKYILNKYDDRESLQKSAKLGYKKAQYEEYLFLKEESLVLLKLAAQQEDTDALFDLSLWHDSQGDSISSEKLLKKAADKGCKEAQLDYGIALAKKNCFYEALEYFEGAVNQGELSGYYNSGIVFLKMKEFYKAKDAFELGKNSGCTACEDEYLKLAVNLSSLQELTNLSLKKSNFLEINNQISDEFLVK